MKIPVLAVICAAFALGGCLAEDESEETLDLETLQDEIVVGGEFEGGGQDGDVSTGRVGDAIEGESGVHAPGLTRMAEPIPHPADPDPTRHDTEAKVYHAP